MVAETRSKARAGKTSNAATSVNKNAVQAYAAKASAVAKKMSLNEQLENSPPELQQAIKQLLDENAELTSANANENLKPVDQMDVDSSLPPKDAVQHAEEFVAHIKVEEEPKDVGLFVSQTLGSSVVVVNEKDTDDPGDLMSWNEFTTIRSKGAVQGSHTSYGYLSRGHNRFSEVIGVGPLNAEKLQLVPSAKTGICLNETRHNVKRQAIDENGKRVNIRPILQGVAWDIPIGHDDPILLMDPRNWATKKEKGNSGEGKGEDERNKPGATNKWQVSKAPYTTLKIKWQIIDDDAGAVGKGNAMGRVRFLKEKTFETRSTLRSLIGQRPVAAPQDFKLGDRVLIEKGTVMKQADMWIYAGAIRSWERHQEWEDGKRPAVARSPTPDAGPSLDAAMDDEEEL
ncbi:hypothetical protein CLIM01_09432 [Colletotrichum limetticola]|uniref:Uncharacterized protein n=1 Tax=Colletotrichum limetticola TaxID=1209924 RepID=A0ABQ9PNZ3_9PEZI|nr:hypothetical protein CLIM01_09432 [Colletotrichum limetticola]